MGNERGFDLLITPTMAILPPSAWTTKQEATPHRMAIANGAMSMFTGIFNLTGNPAISVNCAVERGNIPIGVQIAGAMYRDDLVMKFANVVQTLCAKDGSLSLAKL